MIYFAHPMGTYDSTIEKAILSEMERIFQVHSNEIINPNTERIRNALSLFRRRAYQINVMVFFSFLIDISDKIVFLPYADDTIGAGVWKELKHALEDNADTMEFYRIKIRHSTALYHIKFEKIDKVDLINIISENGRVLSIEETVKKNEDKKANYR